MHRSLKPNTGRARDRNPRKSLSNRPELSTPSVLLFLYVMHECLDSSASSLLKWWVTYTWLWHRVSWENKATKATNALQTQWPQKNHWRHLRFLGHYLVSHTRSNLIAQSLSAVWNGTWSDQHTFPLGGSDWFMWELLQSFALLVLICPGRWKGEQSKPMAQTSAAFSFLWNGSVMPGSTRGSYKAKAIIKRRGGLRGREEV